MVVTLRYDVELSEWEVIKEGSVLEVVDFDEYTGFTAVKYKCNAYYLNNEYFVEVPEASYC